MAMDLKSRIKDYWKNLDAANKKKVVRTIIIVGLMIFGIAVYYVKYGTKNIATPKAVQNTRSGNKTGAASSGKIRLSAGSGKDQRDAERSGRSQERNQG